MNPVNRKRATTSSPAHSAFTLIELLVVIAIIAILAAIMFPVFAQARTKARQASDISNLKQLSLATLMYVQDYDETMPRAGQFEPNGAYYPWEVSVSPYVKSGPTFISLQYGFVWDSNSQGGWDWPLIFKSNVGVTLGSDGVYRWPISYGANGANDWAWSNTGGGLLKGWTDGSNGFGHYGPMAPNPSNLAAIAIPSSTFLMVDAKFPDLWAAADKGILVNGQQPDGFTSVGYFTWTSTDPDVIGAFNGQINIAFCDGHVKSRRMFSVCPNEWTVQDDALQDPLPACRKN